MNTDVISDIIDLIQKEVRENQATIDEMLDNWTPEKSKVINELIIYTKGLLKALDIVYNYEKEGIKCKLD